MESRPRITIVIPTYKRPELLALALQSAINQTASTEDYCILVIDNDPTDNTLTEQLVQSMSAVHIRYVKNEKNVGGYGNWNRGIAQAQTEWVCLLHDDDLLLPTCIEQALKLLNQIETDRLGAVIPKQYNLFDDPEEEETERQEAEKNWRARLDHVLRQKTDGRLWKVSVFDNYMISSVYPAISGGNLLRRSAVLELGGFGTTWPCEDIFFLNRLAQRYDCYLLGAQWGWYRFGENNIWAKPEELAKWDRAKKLFRDHAAKHSLLCKCYHALFGKSMCFFDYKESVRFAERRDNKVEDRFYTWLEGEHVSPIVLRLCRFNCNAWRVWISLRVWLFACRVYTQ